MEVPFSPEIEGKLYELAVKTGRSTSDVVQDVIPGYSRDLSNLGSMLEDRYDDLKGGRLEAIDGEEAFVRLQEKSRARRTNDDA